MPATMTGLGVIIGSGIYVIIGVAAGPAGNAVWLSFLLAAVAASLTALSYGRLTRLYPRNAPEYQFVSAAYGKYPGSLAAWLILTAQVISASAVALGFAGYWRGLTGLPILPSAIVLVVVCLGIIYAGVGHSAAAASVLTVVEILGLVAIIIIGLPYVGDVDYFEMPMGLAGVVTGASLVFFAFIGFEGMVNLSEEMKDPQKDMPRAIMLALGISTLFYVAVAIAAVSVVGWSDLSRSASPLADVASRALGDRTGVALSVVSLAATGNTVLVLLLAASRIAHAMARAGILPSWLTKVDKRRNTPWAATLVVVAACVLFVLIGDVRRVAEFTNFIVLLAFMAVNASVIRIFQKSSPARGIRHVLLNWALPLLGIAVCAWLAMNAGIPAALFGVGVLAVGLALFLLLRLAK